MNGHEACSCLPGYIGPPPNCRPECVINSECPANKACIQQKCGDPCIGSCGINAKCDVVNHNAICSCPYDYIGDPFTQCYPKPPSPVEPVVTDPCYPDPCGQNALCTPQGEAAGLWFYTFLKIKRQLFVFIFWRKGILKFFLHFWKKMQLSSYSNFLKKAMECLFTFSRLQMSS